MRHSPVITFHGGIGTIGGTKIMISEGGTRVLFDFGLTYAPGGDFWGGRLQPRTGAGGLRDLVRLGYVPALHGLYRPEEACRLDLSPGEAGEKTQVFISHLHLDHMAVLDRMADEVPVWMHEDSLRMLRALAESGEPPAPPAGARAFRWGQRIQVGPIEVTPVPVDHDIPGASGLLIRTSAGSVVYSGDLRCHGASPELTGQFVAAARAARPKILLIEGTRLGEAPAGPDRPPSLSEPEVAGAVVANLRDAAGRLGLITLYPRNTGRVGAIARAVRGELGRTLALSPEAAHIYLAMGGNPEVIAVYRRHRDEGMDGVDWFDRLLGSGARPVDAAEVGANPGAYLVQLFAWDMNELVDLEPAPGSPFIHSNGEPLGRFDPSFELFARWLDRFGLELRYAGSTGHATSEDLHAIAAGISPEILMPVHSRMPELLQVDGMRRILPELGGTYQIATGERIW